MIPLKILNNLFVLEKELNPTERAQRVLNASRVPKMAAYMRDNPESYIFSSLVATVHCAVEFEKFGDDRTLGKLHIPMGARFLVLDGQHRRAAIASVLKTNPELADETINVLIYVAGSLEQRQQWFCDLNKNAKKVSKGLSIAYDHRDPLAKFLLTTLEELGLNERIEYEKTTLGRSSSKTLCLGWALDFTKTVLGSKSLPESPKEKARVHEIWGILAQSLVPWFMTNQAEARRSYIISNKIGLDALAAAISDPAFWVSGWQDKLRTLCRDTNFWDKENILWEGRCLVQGCLRKNRLGRILSANLIKRRLGLVVEGEHREVELANIVEELRVWDLKFDETPEFPKQPGQD